MYLYLKGTLTKGTELAFRRYRIYSVQRLYIYSHTFIHTYTLRTNISIKKTFFQLLAYILYFSYFIFMAFLVKLTLTLT